MMIFFAILMIPFIEISLAIAVIREFGFANAFFAWLISFVLGLGLFRTSSLRLTVGVGKAMREVIRQGQRVVGAFGVHA